MNTTEHLLTCLAEEGGEVGKECHKALRFGLDDQVTLDPHGPRGTTGPTNRAKIRMEFIDMLGTYQILVKAGVLEDLGLDTLPYWVTRLMEKKAERVSAYMDYAGRVGALQPPASDK